MDAPTSEMCEVSGSACSVRGGRAGWPTRILQCFYKTTYRMMGMEPKPCPSLAVHLGASVSMAPQTWPCLPCVLPLWAAALSSSQGPRPCSGLCSLVALLCSSSAAIRCPNPCYLPEITPQRAPLFADTTFQCR